MEQVRLENVLRNAPMHGCCSDPGFLELFKELSDSLRVDIGLENRIDHRGVVGPPHHPYNVVDPYIVGVQGSQF